jgi:hypothetical protein
MLIEWKVPNTLSDRDALERMKKHFHKPTEHMHDAWFMGENNYSLWPSQVNPKDLIRDSRFGQALNEIWEGISSFPKVKHLWKHWLLYFLPYAIAESGQYFDSTWKPILSLTISSIIGIFNDEIIEEYAGFRNDLIATLGTQYYSPLHFDDTPPTLHSIYPLHRDIWDILPDSGLPIPKLRDDFTVAMIFCLRYLNAIEFESWVQSLLRIASPQWHLAIILWWLSFHEMFNKKIHSETMPTKIVSSTTQQFRSLAAFVPSSNYSIFQSTLSLCLSRKKFQEWAETIRTEAMFINDGERFFIGEYFMNSLDGLLQEFETAFFN